MQTQTLTSPPGFMLKNTSPRHREASLALLLFVILLFSQATSIFAFEAPLSRYHGFYPGTATAPHHEEARLESRYWDNDGLWWRVLWSTQSNSWNIFQFEPITEEWIDTGTSIESRQSLVDCLWDETTQKLYVVSHMYAQTGSKVNNESQWGRLYRFNYDSATKLYTLDSGFPVDVTRGAENSLTIAKDSLGELWVSYVEDSRVMVNHSNYDDAIWGTPSALADETSRANVIGNDVVGTVAFEGGKVGVMWSNTITGQYFLAVHHDGDPAPLWQQIESVIPTPDVVCTGTCATSIQLKEWLWTISGTRHF